jgi:Holliday junction resolvasome RuvABC endonuclease subunit
MSLLALDLGTDTGYAISSNKGVIVSGSLNFKARRFEGGGMRYLKFRRWLDDLHRNTPITEVGFEEVRSHKGTDAAHVYGGLTAVLTAWCEDNNIPYQGVSVGTIKKFATGSGNADKNAVKRAVREKWGFKPKDDDEADALALLHFLLYEVMN